MSKHIETRKFIKEIANIVDFDKMLDSVTLSKEDKSLIRLHYIEQKDFRYIADILGYAESTIKYRHKKALQKISRIL